MRELLALASWAALTVALWTMAYQWPVVGHVLIPIGAIVMAFVALFLSEGVVQEVRSTIRMRRYERDLARQRASFLAQRKRWEGSGE